MSRWTFLTNHAHVWLCLARDPTLRLRDLAELVGITERAVHRIVHDLAEEGYVEVTREGRRNRYKVLATGPMRHPVEGTAAVGDLLHLLPESPKVP